MPETTEQRCQDAIGVLPLEAVLAQEHDLIHGDDVTRQINAISLEFDASHVIAPAAFAHRLLRARQMRRLERTSRSMDAAELHAAEEAAIDAVGIYVLNAVTDERSAGIHAALVASEKARQALAAHPVPIRVVDGRTITADEDVAAADAALVAAMVPHLNYLLGRPIEVDAAFAPFIAGGAIDALGTADNTNQRLRRLLLEAAFVGQIRRIRDIRLDRIYEAVRGHDTAALCLSGGGIRSATFAVGVIRGLARFGLLSKFDYLSTVSGGGYAGSWLSAWMHHTSASEVQQELKRGSSEKLAPEPAPMEHLRAYSHFLTPRAGLFSTDTWTLAATILRNLLLNWLVLVPLIAAGLLFPRFVVAVLRVDWNELPFGLDHYDRAYLIALFVVGISLGMMAARFVHLNRPDEKGRLDDSPSSRRQTQSGTQHSFVTRCFLPLAAAALFLTTGLYQWWEWSHLNTLLFDLFNWNAQPFVATAPMVRSIRISPVLGTIKAHPGMIVMFLLSGTLMHVGGWLLSGRFRRHPREILSTFVSGIGAGTVGLFIGVWFLSRADTFNREVLYATLAPPAFFAVMLIGSQLFTALTSFHAGDDEREWVTRFNAWLLIAIVMWSAICALVLYGPMVAEGLWRMVTVTVIGGGSGIISVLVARSASNARPGASAAIVTFARKAALALAAPLFVVSIVIALSSVNERLINSVCSLPFDSSLFECHGGDRRFTSDEQRKDFVAHEQRRLITIDSLSYQVGKPYPDEEFERITRSIDSAVARDKAAERREPLVRFLGARPELVSRQIAHLDSARAAGLAQFTNAVIEDDREMAPRVADELLLKELFLSRAVAETRADSGMRALRARFDANTSSLSRTVDQYESRSVALFPAERSARDSLIAAARATLRVRSDRSDAFAEIHQKDSLGRATANAEVLDSVSAAGAFAPSDGPMPLMILILFGGLVGLGLLLGSHIDTNRFSLRAMYETRLVRAYLGASRPASEREPNLFTGFDPRDDVAMGKLWPAVGATQKGGRPRTSPPMHVVNVTLNLVAGTNLAWQQRMAESMTITPLHAGSAFVGYRPTSDATARKEAHEKRPRLYGGREGVTLGTAVTISGAAASPNAGSHSSPLITFLMTFFNARLGAWLGNPGRAGSKSFDRSAPTQKVKPILDEMFGLTSDKSPYVYLSDGGHFENLALYEMVLRRCRFIIVSDAGCDPNATFDDLGNAVRKIRVDLGVPIEFPDDVHIYARDNVPADGSGKYWAVGHIKYSAVDGGDDPALVDGLLIYLKPALYRKEPSDVQQYSRTSDDFPHESTSDQFFSESQFESYRALGEFIVRKLVDADLASQHIDVKGRRDGSLLMNWSELLKASDSNVRIPPSESGVWPTSVEKLTV